MKKGLTKAQADMKLANLTTIFNILYDKTPISRADLAKISGMSPTSITRFVTSMLSVNLLRETPAEEKKVGRTAAWLAINPDAFYSVGINIDSGYIHVALLNFRKQIIADEYTRITIASPTMEQILDIAYDLYLSTLNQTAVTPDRICGIGVSVVGVMNDSEILEFTPQLKWKGINIRRAVIEKFCFENVVVENDCNSSLVGQLVLHPEYKEKSVACICLGSGVGSAFWCQGSLFTRPGRVSFSEIGHTLVEPDGMLCDCGNRGCLQTFIAEEALIKRAQAHEPSITLLEEIHQAWLSEIPWARELIAQACSYIKIGINNLACVYNPDIILIGGESVDDYWDMFYGIMEGPQPLFYPFKDKLTILPFSKKYQSSIIGVSCQVQEIYLQQLLRETL